MPDPDTRIFYGISDVISTTSHILHKCEINYYVYGRSFIDIYLQAVPAIDDTEQIGCDGLPAYDLLYRFCVYTFWVLFIEASTP